MDTKYYVVKSKNLINKLENLGFECKLLNEDKQIYGFEETPKFKEVLLSLSKVDTEYYKINSLTMAKALNYCGFSFYTHGEGNDKCYTFEDTKELREAITLLSNLRKKNLKK